MIQTSGETLARRAAAGGAPLSFRALPSPVFAAVGLIPGVGVPRTGVLTGVGELFTVAVTVGEVVVGEGVGVTVTGGRPTGVPCGPVGVGVPFCVLTGVVSGTGDAPAIVPLALGVRRI